jgi:hypothetical protein
MKLSIATLLVLPCLAAAFVPAQPRAFVTSLGVTKEEDLALTRQVISKFMDGDDAAAEPAAEPAKEAKPVAAAAEEE